MAEIVSVSKEHTACAICDGDSSTNLHVKNGYAIVQCQHCGLVYVNPRISPASVPDLYSKEYFSYNSYMNRSTGVVNEQEILRKVNEIENSYLFNEVVRICNPGRILEVGCAEGTFLKALQKRGWTACGVEVSDWAASYARDELGLQVLTGTLEEADLPENYFDMIYMGDVLEHLYNPRDALVHVGKKLKNGGFFLANTPNIIGLSHRILGSGWRAIAPERHLYYFSPKTAKTLVESVGLRVVSTNAHGFDFVRHIRISVQGDSHTEDCVSRRNYSDKSLFAALKSTVWKFFRSSLNPILQVSQLGDAILIIAKKI